MREISTVQKAKETLWTSSTQDKSRYKTMEFLTCGTDRPVCQLNKTTEPG